MFANPAYKELCSLYQCDSLARRRAVLCQFRDLAHFFDGINTASALYRIARLSRQQRVWAPAAALQHTTTCSPPLPWLCGSYQKFYMRCLYWCLSFI